MGRKHILIFSLIVIFAIMQTSMFAHMLILNSTPNLTLVFVCLLSYLRGNDEGLYYGLVGGLTLDIVIGRSLGFYGLMYMGICFLIGFFPRQNLRDNFFIIMLIIIGAIFPFQLIIYWIKKISIYFAMGMTEFTVETGVEIVRHTLPTTLYNCIVFIPVYFISKKLDRFLDKDKKMMA